MIMGWVSGRSSSPGTGLMDSPHAGYVRFETDIQSPLFTEDTNEQVTSDGCPAGCHCPDRLR